MTSLELQLLWRTLGKKLTAALDLERSRISLEQAEIVADFIDHNEFGLAHDQLVDALADLSLAPEASTETLLNEARQLMLET